VSVSQQMKHVAEKEAKQKAEKEINFLKKSRELSNHRSKIQESRIADLQQEVDLQREQVGTLTHLLSSREKRHRKERILAKRFEGAATMDARREMHNKSLSRQHLLLVLKYVLEEDTTILCVLISLPLISDDQLF